MGSALVGLSALMQPELVSIVVKSSEYLLIHTETLAVSRDTKILWPFTCKHTTSQLPHFCDHLIRADTKVFGLGDSVFIAQNRPNADIHNTNNSAYSPPSYPPVFLCLDNKINCLTGIHAVCYAYSAISSLTEECCWAVWRGIRACHFYNSLPF